MFADDDEAERLVRILDEASRRDGLAVLAWRVLPNHYHPEATAGGASEKWASEVPGWLPWWRLGRPPGEERDEELEVPADRPFVDAFGRSTGRERSRLEAEVGRSAARGPEPRADGAAERERPNV